MITDIRYEVDTSAYHADALVPPGVLSLNQSMAHVMVSGCARKGWAVHPLLGNHRREASDSMKVGTIIDEVLLGDSRRIDVLPYDKYTTKESQAARDESEANGRIPVKQAKMGEYVACAMVISKALQKYSAIDLHADNCSKQVCILWPSMASNGNYVQCRCLIDFAFFDEGTVWDLKCTNNAHPSTLEAKTHLFGYDVQAAAYTQAVEKVFPDLEGRVQFRNLWVEPEFPFLSTISAPSPSVLHAGRLKFQKAVDMFEEGTRTGEWASYTKPGEIVRVGLHRYAREELIAMGMEDEFPEEDFHG